MGRKESTVEFLVKVLEGIREFLEVPNESTGSFFRHMRVTLCSDSSTLCCIDDQNILNRGRMICYKVTFGHLNLKYTFLGNFFFSRHCLRPRSNYQQNWTATIILTGKKGLQLNCN